MSEQAGLTKPRLRGYFHQEAFFVAFGACAMLVARSSSSASLYASLIYSFGLLTLFAISAIYHRPHWQPRERAFMRRLDHCAIFLLIAGTFSPICVLGLSEHDGRHLLIVIWAVAFFGVLQSVFWVHAPKVLTAVICVAAGWLVVPYLTEVHAALGPANLWLLASGGIAYTLGAALYALKRPNPIPGVLGYHELFHLLTIVGAALHFIVIYQLIR